jgi:beta-D-xylosidase 4
MWWNEALHGVANSPGVRFANEGDFSSATSFPETINLASAFDDALVEAVAGIIGKEARAFANGGKAGLDYWTPNINPFKDPRWGRGMETPGEDPLRVSNYVKHLLRGMEGTKSTRQIIATCKHYAAYDLERWNGIVRYSFDAVVTMQDLVEYYLPPFKQCARDSNVGSIMCSYNRVNGTPACANPYLMQTILREHWNWTSHNNYVVSDCNAVHNIYADHHWLQNAAQAAGAAFNAGTDNVCEAGGWSTDVIGAYNQSLVSETVLNKALERQYEGLVRAGYFDGTLDPYRSVGWKDVITEDALALAHQAATDGIVLLKNDGTLPAKLPANKTIAVIGFWADNQNAMLGNYYGRPPFWRTPLYAAQQLGVKINYVNGPLNGTAGNITAAINAAAASDIVFYFGGIDGSIENEDRDRTTITWPDSQLSLINSLSALGKPTVVVQLGTQVDDTPLLQNKNISAILWAGYPGMYGGEAVFDIITGTKAPAGRLPITQYPGNYTSQVPLTNMNLRPSANSPGRTYKWYNNAVLPFGYGLHYANFTLSFANQQNTTRRNPPVYQSNLLLADCKLPYKDLCPFPSIPIRVKNTGNTTSDFVALAFMSTQQGPAPYPLKELVSYKRLRGVMPGEERVIELELTFGNFARVDDNGNTVLYSGAYCLGLDVPEQSKTCFEILGGDQVFDKWPQPPKNGTIVAGSKRGIRA